MYTDLGGRVIILLYLMTIIRAAKSTIVENQGLSLYKQFAIQLMVVTI